MDVGRKLTDSVEKICLFVGYPRSGHSLVGAVLDSHPRALIAHELDLLAHWQCGARWPRLAEMIQKNSLDSARTGRRQSGYSYSLPGQGEAHQPLVLGDKKGGRTAHYLTAQSDILSRFQEDTPWPIFLIHVIRDPRDNVATMARLHELTARKALDSYRHRAEAIASLQTTWPAKRFLDLYLEDLISEPILQLERLFGFLDLPVRHSHLSSIRKLLFDKPQETRGRIDWGTTQGHLQAMCESLPHLRQYSDPNDTA